MSMPTNEKSGKLLIAGVLLVGLAAAAASWWFRYNATHKAVDFWGAEAVELIRDAPRVTLRSDRPSADQEGGDEADVTRDISNARGLTHFRAALLEDRSYDWSASGPPDNNWSRSLVFEVTAGAEPRVLILFSPDFRWAANGSQGDPVRHVVSTAPIAEGLAKFFAEQAVEAPAE